MANINIAGMVSYSNSVVKLKNLNLKKIKHCNINKIFFEQINLPRNLNRIHQNFGYIYDRACFSDEYHSEHNKDNPVNIAKFIIERR